jgi:hypothetical protein
MIVMGWWGKRSERVVGSGQWAVGSGQWAVGKRSYIWQGNKKSK